MDMESMNDALKEAGKHLEKRLRRFAKRNVIFFGVYRTKRLSKAVERWKNALK